MTGEAAKKILYDAVDSIGRAEMQAAINTDFTTSRPHIAKLVSAYQSASEQLAQEDALVFLEAMLHLMLTISAVPSERKIGIGPEMLDLVIPSAKAMKKEQKKSIAIFLADSDPTQRINNFLQLYPDVNCWVVSPVPVTRELRNYSLEGGLPVIEIIVDLKNFLQANGIKTLRLFN